MEIDRTDPAEEPHRIASVRGAWAHLFTDVDAGRLFAAFSASPIRRDAKIGAPPT